MTIYTELPKPKAALRTPEFSKLAFAGSIEGGGGGGGGGKYPWPPKKPPGSPVGPDRILRLQILLGLQKP
jgi:hypothetical protein